MRKIKNVEDLDWTMTVGGLPKEVEVVNGITPEMYYNHIAHKKNIEVYIKPIKTVVLWGDYYLGQRKQTVFLLNNGYTEMFFDHDVSSYALDVRDGSAHVILRDMNFNTVVKLTLTEPLTEEQSKVLSKLMEDQFRRNPEFARNTVKIKDHLADDTKALIDDVLKGDSCKADGIDGEFRIND